MYIVLQEKLPVCASESNHTNIIPLTKFSMEFERLLNPEPFLIVLSSKGILLDEELEKLFDDPRQSRSMQILRLLTVLNKKGRKGVMTVIESLEEERNHIGHEELAEILRKEYCGKNNIYLSPPPQCTPPTHALTLF